MRRHVERSVSRKAQRSGTHALGELMRVAARRFVEEARVRRASSDVELTMEHARSFASMVLLEAAGEEELYTQALELLGLESMIQNRNHTRFWRAEKTRAQQLLATLESSLREHRQRD